MVIKKEWTGSEFQNNLYNTQTPKGDTFIGLSEFSLLDLFVLFPLKIII